jgi:hypothetical protein
MSSRARSKFSLDQFPSSTYCFLIYKAQVSKKKDQFPSIDILGKLLKVFMKVATVKWKYSIELYHHAEME